MNVGIRDDRTPGMATVRALVDGLDWRIEIPAVEAAGMTVRELEAAVAADLRGRTDPVTTAKVAEAEAVAKRKHAEETKRRDDEAREARETEDARRKDRERRDEEGAKADAIANAARALDGRDHAGDAHTPK